MTSSAQKSGFVICINNKGYEASLELRKLYQCLSDMKADEMGMIRVIDEEEEDYLYPADWFVPASLPAETIQEIERASTRKDFSKYFENMPESEEERTALVEDFSQAMMEIYKKAKSEAGYNATRFLSMLHTYGGQKTACMLLEAKGVSEGYTALWEKGRLDLTVEALIFHTPKYHPLFAHDELETAKERLKQYQYQPALVDV